MLILDEETQRLLYTQSDLTRDLGTLSLGNADDFIPQMPLDAIFSTRLRKQSQA